MFEIGNEYPIDRFVNKLLDENTIEVTAKVTESITATHVQNMYRKGYNVATISDCLDIPENKVEMICSSTGCLNSDPCTDNEASMFEVGNKYPIDRYVDRLIEETTISITESVTTRAMDYITESITAKVTESVTAVHVQNMYRKGYNTATISDCLDIPENKVEMICSSTGCLNSAPCTDNDARMFENENKYPIDRYVDRLIEETTISVTESVTTRAMDYITESITAKVTESITTTLIRNLYRNGIDIETIADYLDRTESEIEEYLSPILE